MKKLSSLLLSSLVLSLAAGCPSDDDGDSDTAATATATTGTSETGETETTDPTGETETTDPTGETDTTDPTGETDTSADETGDPTGGDAACVYSCSADEDCQIDAMDLGLSCTDNGNCLNVCANDDECIAQLSGWSFQPCATNDECAAGPCIDLGDGAGGCATEPGEFVDCATFMFVEVEVTDIDGNPVTVCGNDSGTCTDIGDGDMTCLTEVPGCAEAGCPENFTCGDDDVCLCDNDDACGDGTCGADGFCTAPGCVDASDCGDLPFDGGAYSCE